MHIGIITYQVAHLKTMQIAGRLQTMGRHRLSFYAFPFKRRSIVRTPRYQDRPAQILNFDVEQYCHDFSIRYIPMPGWESQHADFFGGKLDDDAPDIFLHCTAKIVPPEFLSRQPILNCHPGILPFNRGVDAFKWSIVNDWPIGNTLHVIDEAIDRGTMLASMKTPVFETDDLAAVCQRQYEYEINLLSHFEYHLGQIKQNWQVGDAYRCSHETIPLDIDTRLATYFKEKLPQLLVNARNDKHTNPALLTNLDLKTEEWSDV